MARNQESAEPNKRRRPPAKSLEGRENQLIAMAYDHAEEQFRNGTATSQLTTHFLKAGTAREMLEREKLRSETILAKAKIDAIESAQRIESLYEEAISAFKSYQPSVTDEAYYED